MATCCFLSAFRKAKFCGVLSRTIVKIWCAVGKKKVCGTLICMRIFNDISLVRNQNCNWALHEVLSAILCLVLNSVGANWILNVRFTLTINPRKLLLLGRRHLPDNRDCRDCSLLQTKLNNGAFNCISALQDLVFHLHLIK